jgi:hypothetical protein
VHILLCSTEMRGWADVASKTSFFLSTQCLCLDKETCSRCSLISAQIKVTSVPVTLTVIHIHAVRCTSIKGFVSVISCFAEPPCVMQACG